MNKNITNAKDMMIYDMETMLRQQTYDKQISVKMTKDMDNAIRKIAKIAGTSPSNVIRNSLKIALPLMKKHLDTKGTHSPDPSEFML